MKKLAVLAVMVVVSFSGLIAQPVQGENKNRPGHEDKQSHRIEYLKIVLDLSDEQASKVSEAQKAHGTNIKAIKEEYKPIMEKMWSEIKEVRDKSEDDKEANKEKTKAIKDKYEKELEPMKKSLSNEKEKLQNQMLTILNTEQAEKLEKLKALKEKNNGECAKGMKGPHQKHKRPHQKPPFDKK